jgi:Set1/Ash2 histone methyltransferase complex subunit ASH2
MSDDINNSTVTTDKSSTITVEDQSQVSTTPSTTKSKKRSRETATGTPAPLQSAIQAIHTTLATSFPVNAALPAFQSLIHSYLISKSNNVPQLLVQNMVNQIQTMAAKNLNDVPPYVHLSVRDAAPQLNIDTEKLSVQGGMRGYRMVRASQGVDSGCWYYEAVVLDPPSVQEVVDALPTNVRLGDGVREGLKRGLEKEQEREMAKAKANADSQGEVVVEESKKKKRKVVGSNGVEQYSVGGHLRMGWSMRTGELQAPVGYDRWSYGIRDINGSRIHHSKREDKWGGVGFQPGDVIGFAICLVDRDENSNSNSNSHDNKRHQFVVNSNHIRFFKNGAPMGDFIVSRGVKSGGEAFDDIQSGTYYPAISSYMGGTARVNFGPHFIHPPKGLPTGMKLRPISEMCVKPMEPEKVLMTFQKEKLLGKKVDEGIVKAIHDAVSVEAKMRHDIYQQHVNDNVEVVRRGRNERGTGTSDLPDPVVTKEETEDVAMEELN